ncbi:NADP-dependent oxidoreductase [Chitinophaga silvisoli]|uniref:NADP-dependent oxidoreductase n=1 Tax=Chitinophaga silvisoli TaxID=2291814 RepID=A0A3E1NZM2_9BACT|nr:NADP-dependent oxidoreductase [Chitinophaga silvisoli]RFM33397.1 NADP-dependent oxidoreductase [Chitinophaga silvisoli]
MKAITIPQFKASPELTEQPKPAVKTGSMLVRIVAAGINPFDAKMIDGILDGQMPHHFPMIPGVDAAGVVEETGEGVTQFKTGDHIYGQFLHAPVGEGTFAEYVVVPEKAALSLAPKNIPLKQAAAIPTAGMTALQMIEKSGLKHESILLVVGATGGVGSFLIQLAAMQGIYVIATVSDDQGASRVSEFGAKETINYKKLNVADIIRNKYPDGVDGLIDMVSSPDAFKVLTQYVKKGGVALTTAFVADEEDLKKKGLQGGNFELKGNRTLLDTLSDAVDNGALKVPVEREITLEETPAALAEIKKLNSKGKTIVVL